MIFFFFTSRASASLAVCRLPLAACRLPLAACRLPLERLVRGIDFKSSLGGERMIFPRFWRGNSIALLFFAAWIGTATAKETPTLQSAFESTTIHIKALPGEVNIPLEWKYTNHGKAPLMVEKFEEACGCLSGKLEQQSLETSQSGVIRASFTPGPNRGMIRKSLHVRFVGYEKPIELIVEATIASNVQLSTQQLVWKSSEASAAKTVDVTTGTDTNFHITNLLGVPETLFKITQETLVPLRHYRLQITPLSENSGSQVLQVRTDSKDPRDQIQAVFLTVEK